MGTTRPWSGKHRSLVWEAWSGNHSLGTTHWEPLFGNHSLGTTLWEPLFGNHSLGTTLWEPLFSVVLVVRAAAANVNPRTRLSHMTPFSGRDWCTRERCRLMMQESLIFPEFPADDSQNFATGSRIPQHFPRKSEAPPPTPLRPGACCTEASCVTHWILVRDPLKPSALQPRACSTEACPGELTPHQSPILRCLVTRMDQGAISSPCPGTGVASYVTRLESSA